MKRIIKVLLPLSVALMLFALPVSADSTADGIWQDYLGTLPDGVTAPKDKSELIEASGIKALLAKILSAVGEKSGDALSFLTMLMGIAALCAVAELSPSLDGKFGQAVSAGLSAITALLIFGKISPVCFSVKESLESMTAFFSGILPVLTGILATGGSVNSAAVQALNMNLTLGAVSFVCTEALMPLVFALFALALAAGADGGAVSSVAKLIKGIFGWVLGIGTAVVIGAVSMQSVIAGAADSAYLRAAKYAASDMIPIVGSTVSGALSTLAGGLSYVKSAVGISAVLVIVTLSLTPLVTLLLYRVAFSVGISVLEFTGAGNGAKCFCAFRSALDALIAVYSLAAVVYIAEIAVFMKSGVSVFG